MSLEIPKIRRQFPYLRMDGEPLVYLDNAATAQKPDIVLDIIRSVSAFAGNAHRGLHSLADQATQTYEAARATVRAFINAQYVDEIVFTRNATESINLVARSFGDAHLKKGDVVVLSILEHHANIVPWLQLKERVGIELVWLDIDATGNVKMNELDAALTERNVKLVAITGQSNVIGVRPDLAKIIEKSHAAGAKVLVDAAQLIAHAPVDVTALDADFLAFSGHKLYGPAGIGVLYAKRKILKEMPAFLGGGMMIRTVTKEGFTPADAPQRFEAGTMPVGEAAGLAAAIDWLSQFNAKDRAAHEETLLQRAMDGLHAIKGVNVLGPALADEIYGCISFTIDGVHPHDLTDLLGQKGFALRAGNHCAQPLHDRLGINASARMSVGIYNTVNEIDALIPAIEEAINTLS